MDDEVIAKLALDRVKAIAVPGDSLIGIKAHPYWDDLDGAPMTLDLVRFVIWMRVNTDYFGGPNLDIEFPEATSFEFLEVLVQNALLYTGE